jgi:uncharacterized membrane protein YhaH (DUF805 family)
MNWYIDVLKKYAVFTGRAHRQEFWMFTLVNVLISFALGIVGGMLHLAVLGTLYSLAVLLPSIGVAVRRLHDIGRTGWWVLIALTGIGMIVLIVFYCLDSQPGDNEYGPNPKGQGEPVPVA